ncbi:MAG: bifunctional adenosylcobinamide kinase/adenosylcobinamide-phosphate guanylyltransferase [Epsilonproteobacteria bacterium]|nr:bifunctional adenosylcobinamide kinase/adenosylcobinamide-phosphate guanylyltransferase [Campylobacterota bacterium]
MGFQALFLGGIKSGKSKKAELYTLESATTKPIYLATTEFIDSEIQKRIEQHKKQRTKKFITIEEPLDIANAITNQNTAVLVECVSMWINNMLHYGKTLDDILCQLEMIAKQDNDVICVINDVSQSVISENKLVRKFVDINGIVSQYIAKEAKEVFHITAGIGVKIK